MAELTLEQHLARHLRFLRASCAAFDMGDQDEAIRIAVSLRVLMHTGGGSPLLSQLGDPPLLSTTPDINEDVIMHCGSLSITRMNFNNGEVTALYVPALDANPQFHRVVPWKVWWSQVVAVLDGMRITRSEIATAAANKEGAHIAPRLPPEYRALVDGPMSIEHTRDGKVISSQRLENIHYTDLRQMAHEVLHSPDLQKYL